MAATSPSGGHVVQFYEDDAFLCEVVAKFLASGLAAGESAIMIAEESRREGVRANLETRGFAVARAEQSGLLTLIDAREMLSRIIVDDAPDSAAFDRAVGSVFEQARASRPRAVRAYGEMVDVLARDGNTAAALQLEHLWKELGARESFTLLCGYSLKNFREARDGALFREVCAAHCEVRPTERFTQLGDDEARMQKIAELQQRAFALEGEVEQRRRSEEALRAALQVRDDFLSIAGHELRTPITSLRLHLGMLARQGVNPPLVTRADRQVARLASLVEQLLEVARLGCGRLPLQRSVVDLVALTRDVVELSEAVSQNAEICVEAPEPVTASVDPRRVELVLLNLLGNALKYGANRPIMIQVQRAGEHASVVVRDRGIGIAREDHARIFERFERAVRGNDYSGLGLGLWISRQIVTEHGGSITVESEPGAGSAFTVQLPIS